MHAVAAENSDESMRSARKLYRFRFDDICLVVYQSAFLLQLKKYRVRKTLRAAK